MMTYLIFCIYLMNIRYFGQFFNPFHFRFRFSSLSLSSVSAHYFPLYFFLELSVTCLRPDLTLHLVGDEPTRNLQHFDLACSLVHLKKKKKNL